MKKLNATYFTTLMILFVSIITAMAQTQTITLIATNGVTSSYNCTTNQVITINSFICHEGNYGHASIFFYNGLKTTLDSYPYGLNTATYGSTGGISITSAGGAVFTGVTNILVATSASGTVGALTFTITTPTIQSVIPANAVVIPTDATGPVQIVLESSSDLVNWTSSLPGTYGSTYTNRFFRVRAIAQ
jgi:hypothetical protein